MYGCSVSMSPPPLTFAASVCCAPPLLPSTQPDDREQFHRPPPSPVLSPPLLPPVKTAGKKEPMKYAVKDDLNDILMRMVLLDVGLHFITHHHNPFHSSPYLMILQLLLQYTTTRVDKLSSSQLPIHVIEKNFQGLITRAKRISSLFGFLQQHLKEWQLTEIISIPLST